MNECEVIICDLSTITYKNICTTYGAVMTRKMYESFDFMFKGLTSFYNHPDNTFWSSKYTHNNWSNS